MLEIELDPGMEAHLERVAQEIGETKAAIVLEALREHLEDLEDIRLAREILANPGRLYSADEIKRELGL